MVFFMYCGEELVEVCVNVTLQDILNRFELELVSSRGPNAIKIDNWHKVRKLNNPDHCYTIIERNPDNHGGMMPHMGIRL